MASLQVLLTCALFATSWAAPQFGVDDQQPTPYEFEYGVNVEETGDVKEHKESVSASGRTEGEYRWLQPNGLFMVVRYYVDGDSGFVAEVSEEPGSPVEARYRNSLSQESSATATATSGASQGSFARSFDSVQSSLGAAVNVISAPRPSLNRQTSFRPTPQVVQQQQPQRFSNNNFNTQQQQQQQSFSNNFNTQRQQQPQSFSNNFNSQQQQTVTNGGFIDGGFIDGGIIDGGIIDGGIIDGGFINGGFINDDFEGFDDDSLEDQSVVLASRNRFQG